MTGNKSERLMHWLVDLSESLLRFTVPICFKIEELVSFDDRSAQCSLHWTQLYEVKWQ